MTNTDHQSAMGKEFHNILKDIESLLNEASVLGGDEFAQVRDKLTERVTTAKAQLSGLSENVADTIRDSAADASGAIRDEPWKAVGTAAVAGLLIGFLFARR